MEKSFEDSKKKEYKVIFSNFFNILLKIDEKIITIAFTYKNEFRNLYRK